MSCFTVKYDEKMQEISTMMAKLKEKTQLEDLGQIKEKLQRMEEDNNRLFNFVNNQEAEVKTYPTNVDFIFLQSIR